jgi:putative glutamine amidotransferase
MRKPRIAIPEIDQNVGNYVSAVHAAGMEAVVISVRTEQIRNAYQQEYLEYADFRPDSFDGLLIPGGWDINPGRYGQAVQGSTGIRDDVDELQLSVLGEFLARQKPVLGICRGLQLINVGFGGTLIQHLPTSGRHVHPEWKEDRLHGSRTREGSWLEALYGTAYTVNSSHHQAVDRPGEGLVIDSWCGEDQVVEALHHKDLPVYGVQWHPERLCLAFSGKDAVDGLKVFEYFCRVCGGDPDAARRHPSQDLMSDRMGL